MGVTAALVASAPRVPYLGVAFRHMAQRWDDPLSGEGARIRGGRFNPPDSFPVLYLCTTRRCAAAELRHLGQRQVIGVAGLLPRVLYRYEVSLDQVLDLTSPDALDHLGVTVELVIGTDLQLPRQIGEAAHSMGAQGIRAPSATGVDQVLALFPECSEPAYLSLRCWSGGRQPPTSDGLCYRPACGPDPWQRLYFAPEPHGQESLRPTLG